MKVCEVCACRHKILGTALNSVLLFLNSVLLIVNSKLKI